MQEISDYPKHMSAIGQFLEEIEIFVNERGITESRFGREALNDPNFVANLRNGRSPSFRTVDRVREYIRDQMNAPANSS